MEEQKTIEEEKIDWLALEIDEINANKQTFDKTEGLKMEENKIYELEFDLSKPWEKWTDPKSGAVKKIIPVTWEGKRYNFWLNVANPTFRQILEACKAGQTKFKIIRNGTMKATRYNIVK